MPAEDGILSEDAGAGTGAGQESRISVTSPAADTWPACPPHISVTGPAADTWPACPPHSHNSVPIPPAL